jgi:hypothetical protein
MCVHLIMKTKIFYNVQSTARQTILLTLWTLCQSYFKGISVNIKLQVTYS